MLIRGLPVYAHEPSTIGREFEATNPTADLGGLIISPCGAVQGTNLKRSK